MTLLLLGGVATTFGALISLANAKFKVWEDPRIDGVRELLPGADCGACGQAGCRAFAEAVIGGSAAPAECTVMGPDEREDVADFAHDELGNRVSDASGNDFFYDAERSRLLWRSPPGRRPA